MPTQKISLAERLEIIDLAETKKYTIQELAKMFNVWPQTVHKILKKGK